MKLNSSRCSRGLSVWITAPIDGSAKYSSRCSGWFQSSVATGSPGSMPSWASAPPSRRARSMQAPNVVRPTEPSGRLKTISREPLMRSDRCTTAVSDSG